jgi:sugar (pentulose or hexulose) kinase
MEGVSLAIGKDVQLFKDAGVDIDEVFCVGGGINNKLLYDIKANVMNIPQIIINESEASLRGNALLAAYGLNLIDNIEKTAKIEDSKKQVIFPNENAVKKYRVLQNDFMKMYNHLLGYWKENI